jgi:hypothetical protein
MEKHWKKKSGTKLPHFTVCIILTAKYLIYNAAWLRNRRKLQAAASATN